MISVRSGSFLNVVYPWLFYNYEYQNNSRPIGYLLLLKFTTVMIQKTKSWWNQGWLFECSQMWHWMTNISNSMPLLNVTVQLWYFPLVHLERGGGRLPAQMFAMSPSSTRAVNDSGTSDSDSNSDSTKVDSDSDSNSRVFQNPWFWFQFQ